MFVSYKTKIILIFVFTFILLEGDTKRPNLKEGILPVKRDYRPSKWVANSAMDVWYGNKSMIDVISREFSDVMYKLTARPVRSALHLPIPEIGEEIKTDNVTYTVSRIEINFVDADNETVHTVHLQPMKKPVHPIKRQVQPTKRPAKSTNRPVRYEMSSVAYEASSMPYATSNAVYETSSAYPIEMALI